MKNGKIGRPVRASKVSCQVLNHQQLNECSLSGAHWIPLLPLCLESEVGEFFKHTNIDDVKEVLRTAKKKLHPFSHVQWIPTETRVGLSFQKEVSSK